MQKKKTQSILSRKIHRKYIVEQKFNPYKPSPELIKELSEWHLPSSSYIKKDIRGKSLISLEEDELFYVAFTMWRGMPEIKLLAKLLFTIKFYARNGDVSKEDIYNELVDKDGNGFISEMYLTHLKEEWNV